MNWIKIDFKRSFKLVDNGDLAQNLHSLLFQNNLLISEQDLGNIEDILMQNKQLETNWNELKKWLEEQREKAWDKVEIDTYNEIFYKMKELESKYEDRN